MSKRKHSHFDLFYHKFYQVYNKVNLTMNNLFGEKWHSVKELIAKKRAEEHWV